MPPSSSLQYANTSLSLLFGRDQCSDVFGSDASNEICSPSRTLCCVRRGQEYPACHQSLGKGWCCIGNNPTDDCYVDQPSVCEEKNSVPCTYLAEGTTEACCPRLTSCVIDTPASKEVVRCNIQYGDLQKAAAGLDDQSSSSSSASPSSSISSIAAIKSSTIRNSANPSTAAATSSIAQAASTSHTAGHAAGTALPTPPPSGTNSQSQGTSGLAPTAGPGLIAGAAVGGTLGFVALLVLGYLFLRRLLKLRQQGGGGGGGGGHPHAPQDAPQLPPYGYHDYYSQAAAVTTTTMVGPPRTYVYPELSAETVVDVLAKHHQQPVELPAAK
ncbi:hypothetical protein MYCTH_2301600 [Thermothelomyces thermophilus ATCC 42464]|uniref:Uncharacterized protein n=1 Tax=Thermothelomyces thermophilus (strain ATCC 42464 / BCRC 31852 / DSM 1799) TaxID=573729 RepID=G2Q9S5_THET4|nr:uncharacterized protein MYCTH_2301600 [Thermothelomyces thermophilus ATCC 42464]AEO56534.1 hypothetical protein MYCTH_2301600 [Thermothelomyces thermophilus ATCC 42464]